MGKRRNTFDLYDKANIINMLYIYRKTQIIINKRRRIMEKKIKEALEQIRPSLQKDGGDIEFVECTDDNIVKVRLQGHCAGCPGAQMTIKGVVEKILKESYPEIAGVESVM